MSNSLNIQLTNELRHYVDMRASDDDVYATPSEYIRDLIRKDRASYLKFDILRGIREIGEGKALAITPMDIMNED